MNMRTALPFLAPVFAPIEAYWQSAAPRSRVVIATALAALVLVLFWAWVWEPIQSDRRQMMTRIPQLERDLDAMRAQSAEYKRLTAMPALPNNPGSTASANRPAASVAALQGIFGATASVVPRDDRGIAVTLSNFSYLTLLDRLSDATARLRTRVVSLDVRARPGNAGAGTSVDAEIVFADDAPRPASPATAPSPSPAK
jgi:type II secretory pathway component PulM